MISAETTENAIQLKELCTVVFLAGNSWMDLKTREVSLPMAAVYGIGGIICSILEGREVTDWLVPLALGIIFLALSFLTGGGIGAGDSLILIALGSMTGTGDFIRMMSLGFFMAAVWAGILMTLFQKSRKTEIPMIPFLLAGYLAGVLL